VTATRILQLSSTLFYSFASLNQNSTMQKLRHNKEEFVLSQANVKLIIRAFEM
jgi:hypothetical protein